MNIFWLEIIHSVHICATDVGKEKGTCTGDSGGPLFLPENGRCGSGDTHTTYLDFLNPGIQSSELQARGAGSHADVLGFQISSQESHLWKSGSWKIRMEHKTVIVHLIFNKFNHCIKYFSTKHIDALNCAINWFESTNIMTTGWVKKNWDLKKIQIALTHSILKLKSIVIPLNQMSQSGEKHAQD